MTENAKDTLRIAAELDAVAAGLSITAQLFEGEEYKTLDPKVFYSALSGYEFTLQRLSSEVLEL